MHSIKNKGLEHLQDLLFFLKSLIVVYLLCVFKYLFRLIPDSFFEIIPLELKYCRIETYEFDSESDTESDTESDKGEDTDLNNKLKQKDRDIEMRLLSFMLNINLNKLNKYKCSNGLGVYYIRTAFVFRNNNGRVCGLVPVQNKLALWSRLFSKDKLYIGDILNLAGVDSSASSSKENHNYYIFMIVEEVESGYSYKILANLTSKKYIPDYSDIMFSKLCVCLK